MAKCDFNKPEVKFLGHVVGRDGIKVDPAKIAVIQEWPVPTSTTELRQFLGLANYFRKFIQGYSSLAAPLTALISNDKVRLSLTPSQMEAFQQIKHALTHAPVLTPPDFSKSFEVVSDASLLGTGAVLMQDNKPVAYTSSKFIPAERNYTTGEQELLGVFKALKEWRCYLEGSKTTLVTDHNPLVHLQSQPSLSRRQARWMEYMARFEYDWLYRPGRLNVADPISRNPALAPIYTLLAALMRSQVKTNNNNSNTNPKKRKPKGPVGLALYDRILDGYEIDPWFADQTNINTLQKSVEGFYQQGTLILVPDTDTLRSDIISMHHAPPLAGHVGISKTLKAVQRTFWWPKMKDDVINFINSCQSNKSTNKLPGGLLHSLPIPDIPWESISTDLIISLPLTTTGFDAILVWVDRLTKMVHLCPALTSFGAEQWARAFVDNVVRLHGIPKSIVSDRDSRFTGHFWTAVCKLLDIKQAMSTSFHPQTDGQTERANRTLEDMLRHYINPSQNDWDQHLAAIEFAINNSWQESTKETPFFLNYGHHPLTPIQLSNGSVTVPKANTFVQNMHERISQAKLCLQQAQARQKAYADTHRRDVSFTEGDQILLSTKNIKLKKAKEASRKLMPRWIGPFRISKLVGTAAVKLDLPPKWAIHPVFHVSLIKPYLSNGLVQPPPSSMDYIDDEPIFQVDCLLDKRLSKKGNHKETQYLVKWTGCGPEHNTWEPSHS